MRGCRPSGPLAIAPKNALQAGGPGTRGRCAVPLHTAEHTPMRKKIRMTGGDKKEKKSGEHGAMVPWCHGADNPLSWLNGTPHLFCPVEDGSNPGGDRDAPNNPNPLFWARERGREKQRERERVEHSGKGTERCNRRDRAGESKREWEGESRRETHRARDLGLTGAKGGGGFELTRIQAN